MFNIFDLFKKQVPPYRIPKTWKLTKSNPITKRGKEFITLIEKEILVGDFRVVEIVSPKILCKVKKSVKVVADGDTYYKITFYKVHSKLCRICRKLFELVDMTTICPLCKVDQ